MKKTKMISIVILISIMISPSSFLQLLCLKVTDVTKQDKVEVLASYESRLKPYLQKEARKPFKSLLLELIIKRGYWIDYIHTLPREEALLALLDTKTLDPSEIDLRSSSRTVVLANSIIELAQDEEDKKEIPYIMNNLNFINERLLLYRWVLRAICISILIIPRSKQTM